MNPKTLDAFKAHAVAEYPRECCGVVVVCKGRERYVEIPNLADKPGQQFFMSPEHFSYAEDLGEIVAICHSHPNLPPRPSQCDLVECEKAEIYEWHIINVHRADDGTVQAGALYSFKPSGYEAPLVGREFAYGTLDCYTILRDYYRIEYGIALPDFDREGLWWNEGKNYYRERFPALGFREIPRQDVKPGDIFLMTLRAPVENHLAVYIGDDKILHHVWGRLSSRDVYSGYWRENTTVALRFKGINE